MTIDRLARLSSLFGVILIFCGVFKLIIYYSAFNVNIVDFLTFTEIITSFLDDINILIVFVIIMFIISYATINVLQKHSGIAFEEFLRNAIISIYSIRIWYILFFVTVFSITSLLVYFNKVELNYIIVYLVSFCFMQALTYLSITKNEKGEIVFTDFLYITTCIISLVFSVFLLAVHDVKFIKSHLLNVVIKSKSEIIMCNPKNKAIYLGKTEDFVFVNNDSSKSTIVIPVSEVKSIEFK